MLIRLGLADFPRRYDSDDVEVTASLWECSADRRRSIEVFGNQLILV